MGQVTSQCPRLESLGEEAREPLCMAGKMVVGMGAHGSQNGGEVTQMLGLMISKVPPGPVIPGLPSVIPSKNPPLEAASPAATTCAQG